MALNLRRVAVSGSPSAQVCCCLILLLQYQIRDVYLVTQTVTASKYEYITILREQTAN